MKPTAYESFRDRVRRQLEAYRGAAADALRLHDARGADLEMRHRNLLRAIETGDDPTVLVGRLNVMDAELKEMRGKRGDIVPPEIELPDRLPELYREMVSDLVASLSEESVAGRAADELHDLVDRIVVHWDEEARGHWLSIEGNLLKILQKNGACGCGRRSGGDDFC